MKSAILDFVRERGSVSFVELHRLLGDVSRGDYGLCMGSHPNLVYWAGMSEQFVNAIEELLDEGLLLMKPASPLVYLVDGCLSRLPLARGKYRYKEPHWAPVVFDAAHVAAEDVRRGMRKMAEECL